MFDKFVWSEFGQRNALAPERAARRGSPMEGANNPRRPTSRRPHHGGLFVFDLTYQGRTRPLGTSRALSFGASVLLGWGRYPARRQYVNLGRRTAGPGYGTFESFLRMSIR